MPQIWGNVRLDLFRLLFIFHFNGNLNSSTTTDLLKFGEKFDWICLGCKPYFFLGRTFLSLFITPVTQIIERISICHCEYCHISCAQLFSSTEVGFIIIVVDCISIRIQGLLSFVYFDIPNPVLAFLSREFEEFSFSD